jgi:hypothetical protein
MSGMMIQRREEKIGRVATWWETDFPTGRYDEENKKGVEDALVE